MKHIISISIFWVASLVLSTWLVEGIQAQTNWEKYPGNPVLDIGPQPWDSTWVFYPEVFFDGAVYRMWYSGYDASNIRIGYATSLDRTTWTKLNNPVLDIGIPGSWDDVHVIDASVIKNGSGYHMWYRGEDGITTRIGYATSLDGVIWTKANSVNPVLDVGAPGSWDSIWIMHPTVIFDGTTYHMWYMGWDGNIPRIGYATSPDGINWTKYDDPSTVNPPFAESDPVMNPGDPGMWDAAAVLSPCVIYTGTTYQMWYNGGDSLNPGLPFPVTSNIGYATSFDGITWTKFANPVLSEAGDPDVIYDGNIYHMYYDYGTFDGVFRFRIGYATDSTMVGIGDDVSNELPRKFDLSQNYPNPFNPQTTIEFALPNPEFVTLKIYNILGEELATLVSERLRAGSYKYDWDASNLASGIYLYRLKAGDYVEGKKMILMK